MVGIVIAIVVLAIMMRIMSAMVKMICGLLKALVLMGAVGLATMGFIFLAVGI